MSYFPRSDQLPDGWEVKPLGSAATCVVSSVDKLSREDEIPIRLCNYTDVYNSEFITLALDFMRATATEAEIAKFGLLVGDVIITTDSESWDDIGVPALVTEAADDLVCGYHLALIRPLKREMDGAFLLRCLQAKPIRVQLELMARGVTRSGIPKSDISAVRLPVPPLAQQRVIADYLSRETARLDSLLTAKQRVLGLLAERRVAQIARAVTRGLDPHVQLRDSGVSWLGKVPAHWNIAPLRFLVDLIGGATPNTRNPEYWDGSIPWVSPKDMKRSEIGDTQDHVTDLAVLETTLRLIQPGAVLIVVRGMILNHSFPVALNSVPATINRDMKALVCDDALAPRYLQNLFEGFEKYAVSLADSSAHGMRRLDTTVLGRLEIPVPPMPEQQQIVKYIRDATARIDALQSAITRSIIILKERREALVAAVVTGQQEVIR